MIRLETEMDLSTKTVFKKLARGFFRELPEHLQPNRFGGFGENPRSVLQVSDIDAAANAWHAADGGLSIARKKEKIQYLIYFTFRRGFNNRGVKFPWLCSVHFNSKMTWPDARCFMKVLVKHLLPAFAFSSTIGEVDDQHRVVYESSVGTIEKKVRLDIGGQLPGIYRLTYFGPWAVEKIGNEKFSPLVEVSKFCKGVLVDLAEVGDFAEAQRKIRLKLGINNFFDRKYFDPKGLEMSKEDIAVVEAAIARHKKSRR